MIERRERGDFERDVISFMSRIDQHLTDQRERCLAHADMVKNISKRTSALEAWRNWIAGAGATIGAAFAIWLKEK
jgi:hypothetical protein